MIDTGIKHKCEETFSCFYRKGGFCTFWEQVAEDAGGGPGPGWTTWGWDAEANNSPPKVEANAATF